MKKLFFIYNPYSGKGLIKSNLSDIIDLMVKAGCWGEDARQIHRFFAWKDVKVHMEAPYVIEAADCIASETRLTGSVCVTQEEAAAHPQRAG